MSFHIYDIWNHLLHDHYLHAFPDLYCWQTSFHIDDIWKCLLHAHFHTSSVLCCCRLSYHILYTKFWVCQFDFFHLLNKFMGLYLCYKWYQLFTLNKFFVKACFLLFICFSIYFLWLFHIIFKWLYCSIHHWF